MSIDQKKLAKDVAKQMDRRRMRRRLFVLVALLGAAIAAALYLRCGRGWGTGGKGPGKGGGTGTVASFDAGPTRCAVRLTATGITVDGKQATREEAIAACKRTTGADVLVTGDARQGDWDELRGGFEAASVPFFAREPRGVTPPMPAGQGNDAAAPPTD